MQYSIVNGQRTEAKPQLVGLCICCNKPTYSACGKLITWHWRHRNKNDCDAWWETETDWHREWKSNFPEEWREIVHHESLTGEKHIADIKTHKNVVLEFQNSTIDLEELQSREKFYERMIWIINGALFRQNFEFGYKLPDPNSQFPKQYKFLHYKHTAVYDCIKYPEKDVLVEIISRIDNIPIAKLVEKFHTKHYAFNWKNPRQVWFQAQMPIFIDFNDGLLWRILLTNEISDRPICCYYTKKEFINHYLI
jgi:competence protein CoiA